jgi:hypothetical protein
MDIRLSYMFVCEHNTILRKSQGNDVRLDDRTATIY